jgi:multimeric flavodoxin WrbA/putative sterol carrier protein
MKALIVYGSPRHKRSASYHIGKSFADGLRRAGLHVDEIMLSKQNIHHCIGCFTCWTKTPGVCIHKDDMVENLPKLQKANLIVFSTPLYVYNVTGLLKNFLDRQIPLLEPYLVEKGEATGHPRRDTPEDQKVFLISVAGFPELSHFNALVTMFKQMYRGGKYIGEILIPGSEPMSRDDFQDSYKELYKLIEQAGFEVGKNGIMSKETQKKITAMTTYTEKEIELFREMANKYWDSFEEKDYSKVKLEVTNMEPLKTTDNGMSAFFAGMAKIYNPKAVPGLKGVMQFNLDDERYYLIINEGKCKAYKGSYPEPTFTIISPKDVWMKITSGELSGAKAFMQRMYKVEGDMKLLMKMNQMFSR